MAQLLLFRTIVEPAPGAAVAATGVEAVPSTADGGAGGGARLIDDVARMLAGAAVPVTNAPVALPAFEDATAALEVATQMTAVQPEAASSGAGMLGATPASMAAAALAASAAARGTAEPRGDAASGGSSVADVGTPASAAIALAATERPAEAVAEVRERGARGTDGTQASTAAVTATAQTSQTAGGVQVTQVASTARAEATGPVTVQIANTVQAAVLRGEHEVRLMLNPPELGRVEIRIVEGAGGISVQLRVEQAGARDLIQAQLPVLHQALEARDLRVERLQVAHAEESGAAQSSFDSRGFMGQQQQQGDDAPEWSPLASFGEHGTEPDRDARRPRATSAGVIDVMA